MTTTCHRLECNELLTESQSRYGKYCSLRCAGIVSGSKQGRIRSDLLKEEYESNPKICSFSECGRKIPYQQKANKYCGHSCRAKDTIGKRTHSLETKRKISEKSKLQKRTRKRSLSRKELADGPYSPVYLCICSITGKKFFSKSPSSRYSKESLKSSMTKYRIECRFRFNINEVDSKIDSKLLHQHGKYDQYTNPNGAVMDHMFSVSDGFRSNVDPGIINHPANCQILLQKDNQSKGSKSSISLDELLSRIRDWS